MPDRRSATATTAGILRPEEFARHVQLTRREPAPDLARWVENHWRLRWSLPPGRTFPSQVLPHPTCNLTVERGSPRAGVGAERVLVTGVTTERFDVATTGEGWVWGVRFRPGGLAALLGSSVRPLTDRTVAASALLPARTVGVLGRLHAGLGDEQAADLATEGLRHAAAGRVTQGDAAYDEVIALVEALLADRSLVRVQQVVEQLGVPRRRLERLFSHHLGVTPKWVLARYRMHDVVSDLDDGYDGSLADLAVRYGWYDQAHFGRDFAALVGTTPGAYRAQRADSAFTGGAQAGGAG
ncbi:helix-turn-helix domain-containing protein [Nocardioides nanhaiensis]|uniref:Helix-turn-helix domain-containing protein n=1 Tax=Nocardioides nanhaiensis TaxID=1476871 RepID=A0ABP8W6X3_9ACTN